MASRSSFAPQSIALVVKPGGNYETAQTLSQRFGWEILRPPSTIPLKDLPIAPAQRDGAQSQPVPFPPQQPRLEKQAHKALSETTDTAFTAPLVLCFGPEGVTLTQDTMTLRLDFYDMMPRIAPHALSHELLVRATKLKAFDHTPVALDATAGLGEDAFLLAAAGFEVYLFEQDPIIAVLLEDALARAKAHPKIASIAQHMHVHEANSIEAMRAMAKDAEVALPSAGVPSPDVIYLDPMFPKRTKSATVKKKFQLLHQLEQPCADEGALVEAAFAAKPRKVVVKRPLKGPYLADKKPNYSLKGKMIRYDCFVFAHS